MFKNNLISNYADLYSLKKEDLLSLERMAEKSVENIFQGLINSKKIPFERVLFALGIRYVGQTVSKNLANQYKSIDNLILKTYDELIMVDEIGERIAKSVVDFFNDSKNILNSKKNNITFLNSKFDYSELENIWLLCYKPINNFDCSPKPYAFSNWEKVDNVEYKLINASLYKK